MGTHNKDSIVTALIQQNNSLPVISGIDTAYGVKHTGGVAEYMAVLKQFCLVAKSDLAELISYVDEIKKDAANTKAVSNFRIKVHAMKATANVMGALRIFIYMANV